MPPPPLQHPNCVNGRTLYAVCGHILYFERIERQLHNDQGQGLFYPCALGRSCREIVQATSCQRCVAMVQGHTTNWVQAARIAHALLTMPPFPNIFSYMYYFDLNDAQFLSPREIEDRISDFREFQMWDRGNRIIAIIQPVVGNPSGEECTICLCKWDDHRNGQGPERPIKLPCQHEYGMDCIMRWLMRHDTCPQCRGRFV